MSQRRKKAIRHFRRGADTALIALFILLPIGGIFALGGDKLGSALGRSVAVSASLAMPEAALAACERLSSELYPAESELASSEHSGEAFARESEGEQEESVPEPEAPAEPAYDPEDVAAAEALIPEERRGAIETTQYLANPEGEIFIRYGAGSIRNSTDYSNAEMLAAASEPIAFSVELSSAEPQVLIVHTHGTESYDRFDVGFYDSEYPSRLTDPEKNVVAVGAVLCEELNALGINSVQAAEFHDYPSYNGSYARSEATIRSYLERFPSIKVVLDIHRDGIEREDGTRLKPTSVIEGEKTAQIMIVCGAGDGIDDVPNFRQNLAFAARLNDKAESLYGGLTRPLYLAYRHYNQDLTPGTLLVEMGSHSNTLEEAKRAAKLLAAALYETLSAEGGEAAVLN
ncbi:MAG: stage II sporulation protein P [Oscillospiraceae bacterium]|nr:stage II sporulation protein P [Oscillospiraceae bacterium]